MVHLTEDHIQEVTEITLAVVVEVVIISLSQNLQIKSILGIHQLSVTLKN